MQVGAVRALCRPPGCFSTKPPSITLRTYVNPLKNSVINSQEDLKQIAPKTVAAPIDPNANLLSNKKSVIHLFLSAC